MDLCFSKKWSTVKTPRRLALSLLLRLTIVAVLLGPSVKVLPYERSRQSLRASCTDEVGQLSKFQKLVVDEGVGAERKKVDAEAAAAAAPAEAEAKVAAKRKAQGRESSPTHGRHPPRSRQGGHRDGASRP